MSTSKRAMVEVENVLHPGKVYRVDAEKYEAMKSVFLEVLPSETPGLSAAEIIDRVTPLLPQHLFPGGEKAGWWVAAVQLDLEAKGIIRRNGSRPVRLYRL